MAKSVSKQQVVEKNTQAGKSAPPVVTILGHVDHGKTTLLDHIRQTHVAEKEAGGITQHISAYQVEADDKKITFIDTPGHEAFSKMRERGAKVTDLVILVVAADDGVMPQTKESIAHIKAAQVPFVVAINKMDLPGANVERVKKQLAEEGVLVEGYGGDVVAVPISAKTGQGVAELLEMISLVAELSEIKKDTKGNFEGVVIESYLDKFRGPLATAIVKKGILRVGDVVFGNTTSGKIRSIGGSTGESKKEASVSEPIEIIGLEKVPEVGDILSVKPKGKEEEEQEAKDKEPADWFAATKASEIRLVLKADTYGSLEAISNSIESFKSKDQEVKFIHRETGDISDNDVLLASASRAVIIGFNVKVPSSVEKIAQEEGVNIRTYSLIYELLEELQEGLSALSEAKRKKEILGQAEILTTFGSDEGKIAGCKVTSGRINREDSLTLIRNEKILSSTKIKSMKHKLSDINEAKEDMEFGVIFEKNVNFAEGDIIQALKE